MLEEIRISIPKLNVLNALRDVSEDKALTPRERLAIFKEVRGALTKYVRWEEGTLSRRPRGLKI